MSNTNFTINLKGRKDSDGNTYYIGKCKFPGTLDFSKGVSFIIFTSEPQCEELQIVGMTDKENDQQ